MAKVKVFSESRKITFGKKKGKKARNMNTPKGKSVSKYRGQGRR
jgi:hypothetical protein